MSLPFFTAMSHWIISAILLNRKYKTKNNNDKKKTQEKVRGEQTTSMGRYL